MTPSVPRSPASGSGKSDILTGLTSTQSGMSQGSIVEVIYSAEKPGLTSGLLLPLLRQLGEQPRWQLWLTPVYKLNRYWLDRAGLPVHKIMQARFSRFERTLDSMEKALISGNFSVVVCWSSLPLTETEYQRLSLAAEQGNAMGLIMRPECNIERARPRFGLEIHSSRYH